MSIEAPCSKYRKTNFKIGIVLCFALAIWCVYDGYFNEKWIQEHTDKQGNAEAYLVLNRQGPYYLVGAGLLLSVLMGFVVRRRVLADEESLVINDKERITYDSIEKVDKTYFDKKGYFVIIYRGADGREVRRKLSDRSYDNLPAVLERLVAEIS